MDFEARMNWKLPNQLTMARLVLSAVFFVLLGVYDAGSRSAAAVLNAAFVVFIVAGITDVLDGYIARKWNLTSAFGRIVDPFVDKVLVVGAFVMLSGANFQLSPVSPMLDWPRWLHGGMATAVQSWMVVCILAREFIVSAIRGYSESQGVKFPAIYAGKIKMLLQTVAICTALFQLANLPQAAWAAGVKVAGVWLALLATVFSGLAYVGKARRLISGDHESPA
jgi:CDP-diacylglycerol--glycerol-3-phosphate 3-phosphatidyltransferase